MFGSILNMPWILNMPRFKICQGYTRSRIKFSIINIWRGSRYASSSEYTSVTQGSVENTPSYMFDRFLSMLLALNMRELHYTRVVNMPRLHMVLCKLYFKDSSHSKCLELWVLNMLRFWKYQESKYAILKKVPNKILHRIYLTGFWMYQVSLRKR